MQQRSPTAVFDGFVPARLRIARQARGLKQNDLARVMNCVPATVSKWESDNYGHFPDSATLVALSNFLEVDQGWFFKPLPCKQSVAFFRSLRSELAIARDRVSAKLCFVSEIFQSLFQRVEFPDVDLPDLLNGASYRSLNAETIERVAMSLRDYWGIGDDPIEDLMLVIENAGIIVSDDYASSTKLDGVSRWIDDRPFIFLAKDKDGGARRRFDAAHELGHLILHQSVDESDLARDLLLIEEQAMIFAGALLLPGPSFSADVSDITLDNLADIKPRWKVSIAAMIKRLRSLNLISAEHETNLWKYYSYRRWRGNEPHDESIIIERPLNLKAAIEMVLEDGAEELVLLMSDIGLSAADVGSLSGIPSEKLEIKPRSKPRLRLVKREATEGALVNPAND